MLDERVMYLKKKKDVWEVALFFLVSGVLAAGVINVVVMLIKLIIQLVDLIKSLLNTPLWVNLIAIGTTTIMICIACYWNKRDDFFYFVASMLSKPSEYFYNRKKKQLLNYRLEIKKLVASIEYFSQIDSETITKEEFWKFADDVSKQNERLEKNRVMLERQDNRINFLIQIFILICGVITSLLL